MRIGISTAQSGQLARPAAVAAAARAAEQLGYSSLWVLDRLPPSGRRGPSPVLDPLGVLAATAAVTTAVGLGAGLVVGPWYSAALLARSLTSLDVLSDGRLTVALTVEEDSHLPHLQAILAALHDGPRPIVLLAGHTSADLDRVARHSDGWSPPGLPLPRLALLWADVRDRAEARGRDPETLKLVVRADITLTDRPVDGTRASFEGNAAQVADDVVASLRLGADEVVLRLRGDLSLDQVLEGYARVAEATETTATPAPVQTV
jgi:alkanesulfonate monooxygenase SsuD/methylene tetrahydromethanopterin reductase-like flavin-dependent oxidoreductase (luciferase family)